MTVTTGQGTAHPATADRADAACHDLLVRLAGRLPDRLLWRLREWLATGGHPAVVALLPRAVLRHRVGLTDAERDLLETAVAMRGASQRVLDAILTLTRADEPAVAFRPGPADPDAAALSLLAVARGETGCVELRQVERTDGRRAQRVVLVRADVARPWVLAGTLARLLRAHGDPTPCVEMLPPAGGADPGPHARVHRGFHDTLSDDLPAYHRAALAGSTLLWQRSPVLAAG
jgi:hypothetical protein